MVPPLGYLAELARLFVYHRAQSEEEIRRFREHLRRELNRAIPLVYSHPLLNSWEDVEKLARTFTQSIREAEDAPSVQEEDPLYDWGDAPLQSQFFGRQAELERLRSYILEEHRQLIGLWGEGGIGKTALAAQVAQSVMDKFQCIIWRSLRNAPPPSALLRDLVLTLSNYRAVLPTDDPEMLLNTLLSLLRQRRCLIVLDNLEAIFKEQGPAGHCREEYRIYCELIRRLGETHHQSCILLTSRERPSLFVRWKASAPWVATMHIKGLTLEAGRLYLQNLGLKASPSHLNALIKLYAGNPLMLALSAETIQQLFLGDVRAFLRSRRLAVGDIRALLDEQVQRLSPIERDILTWLAIEREPVDVDTLVHDLQHPRARYEVLNALLYLNRRHLVQRTEKGFTLQNVIMEYMTDRFLDKMTQSILKTQLGYLDRFTVQKSNVPEFIREYQRLTLVHPLLRRLEESLGTPQAVSQRLTEIKNILQQQKPALPGYAAGNMLTLLQHLHGHLDEQDFSGLTLRHVYVRHTSMRKASLVNAHVIEGRFADTFGIVFHVAFSPNGRYIAAALDNQEVRVWDLHNEERMFQLLGHTDSVRVVRFHPKGGLLASGGDDGTIRLWNPLKSTCLGTLVGHQNRVRTLAFSPDGRYIFSAGDDQVIRKWDVQTRRLLAVWTGHTAPIWSLAVSPNGKWVATGSYDQTVRVWDADTGELLHTIPTPGYSTWSLSFHPRNYMLAGGLDPKGIRIWDTRTFEEQKRLDVPSEIVWSVAFSRDGRFLVAASEDRTVRIWRVAGWKLERTLVRHTAPLRTVDISPNAKLVASAGRDYTIRLWDREAGTLLRVFAGFHSIMTDLAVGPEGRYVVVGSSDRLVRVWDVEKGILVARLPGHKDFIHRVAMAPQKFRFASGSDDGKVIIWEGKQGRQQRIIEHATAVIALAFSPGGKRLATGTTDNLIHIWDLLSGEEIAQLEGHESWVRDILFLPDSRLVSGSEDSTIRVWDLETKRMLAILRGHESWVMSLALHPNARLLASGSDDQTVRLWDLKTMQAVQTLTEFDQMVWSVAWSPDGALLATAEVHPEGKVWDVQKGTVRYRLVGHEDKMTRVQFAPHGRWLVTGSEDSTVRVWRAEDGELITVLGPDRLYEGLQIRGLQGISPTIRHMLL
ncbi:MAG: hypothetical protein GXO55_02270, partial [Chloroflexi bacterium]|nr:hypothetical protein [Chloroflexota bacterium]